EKELHAEATADIGSHDADTVFRDLEDALGQQVADEMRALGRAPQGIGFFARIVFANRTPRLHRIDDDAVVDELERDAMPRAGHRPLDRRAVADLPVEREV